jgi:NTE family protein
MGPQVYPIPAPNPLGAGKERAIVFGGGGEWFTAWMLAFCTTVTKRGVDLGTADVCVGTSAGSIMGAYLASGQAPAAVAQFEQLAAHPEVLEKMVVTATGSPTQARAAQVMATATDVEDASIQTIGRAAMASRNMPVADYIASLDKLLGGMPWPGATLHTTGVDCYTGERVVVSYDSGIPIATACAASSSLPGVNGPTWLGDHYCMDGGISSLYTHSDLMAGAKRVVIFAMMCEPPTSGSFGLTIRVKPNVVHDEVAYLKEHGSDVFLVCANPAEGIDFMNPATLKAAMESGASRGDAVAAELAAFWND